MTASLATTWPTPPVGTLGFDTSGAVRSQAQAQFIYTAGYRFAIRYVTVPLSNAQPEVLTPTEAGWLLDAGIGIGIVQMYQSQANISAAQGTADGQSAAQQAAALGAPFGMVLWCDVEGLSCNTTLIDYLNNWSTAVTAGGYAPGIYNAALTTTAYCNQVQVNHWWLSGAGMEFQGNVGNPARGYQMFQLNPANQTVGNSTVGVLAIDVDVTQYDNDQWTVVFWAPST